MTIETDTPPVAARKPSIRELHGETVVDEYAWMRHGGAALMEYLSAERAYYDAGSTHLESLVESLAAETAGRYPAGDEYSVSWPEGGYVYRTRLPEGEDNVQLLRGRAGEGEPEQVLLDENLIAARTGYVDIGGRRPSPDGTLLAWSSDGTGAELYELRIRDLGTGEDLPEVIGPTAPGVAWSTACDYLFYLVPDKAHRPFQVWRHRVGSGAGDDELVFEEPDQRFDVALSASRSGQLGIITLSSRDTTEVWLIPLERPLDDPVLVQARERGIEYRVDHARGGDIYLVTNWGEEEFTLMRAPLASPDRGAWTAVTCSAIAPARADTRLLRCDLLAEHLVLTVRRGCEPLLVITDHDGGNAREVAPGIRAGSIMVDHAEDYDRGSVIIVEESLIEPKAWYELELGTAAKRPLKRMEVRGYDPARYRTKRFQAPARDGTLIPVTLAWREDTALDGTAPCLLYGYGAYEIFEDPGFERRSPSLLDRGVVYALAHIRGGGECGRSWWQQGRLEAKRTTFTDYLAVADWLAGGDGLALVDGSRIVTRGASAGGLLQGAVFSMRPDRWRAVIAEVPFVDCVNTMLDPSIPLTANEWDEWGDPRKPEDYAWISAYSPYENPPSGSRPPMLVTGAVNDPRVGIHEPAKWVAKLRATDTNGATLLFRPQLGVGAHAGASGRNAQIREQAEIQAFALDAMGITA